jgi:hypothetical protein
LALALTMGFGVRADAQFGLVQLPLDDPAYVQLTALEHMGCAEARVSPRRPYDVRSIRVALTRARNVPACRGIILDALVRRFAPRSGDRKSGLRAGAKATAQITGLSGAEFEPLWNDIRPTDQGDQPAVGIVHGRLDWGDGSADQVVAVGDLYAQTGVKNDPQIRARVFRQTSGVLDFSEAYLSGRVGPFEGTIGRGQEAWLGESQESLVLSANGPPIDRVTGNVSTDHFEARALLGSLDDVVLDSAQDNIMGVQSYERYYRYLAAYAVTWRPSRVLEATAGQLAILPAASRALDLYYVNPFSSYPDTTRRLVNVTNHVETFGGLRLRAGRATFDGEVLADQIVRSDHLAYLVTASTPIPVRIPVSLNGTFESIGRDTYTSQYYASVPEHYGVPLGSVLGPDAELAQAGAEVFLAGPLRVSGDIGLWRRGKVRIDERPAQPATGPDTPEQRATIGDLTIQFLTPVVPVTLRFTGATVSNVNNVATPTSTYGQTQLIASYAFRYP